MIVKIKKLHENAVIPKYQTLGSGCFDLTITSVKSQSKNMITYGTGLSFEIPEAFIGNIYPRSSIIKTGVRLANNVGKIDSDYRGEILVVFDIINQDLPIYEVGERCCQMEIVPIIQVKFEEVSELNESERSNKGFGSSGK